MAGSSSFLKNSFLTLSREILVLVIGLASSIIIARYLGPHGQGAYALVILLPTMLVTFLNLGMGASSVYYVGKKVIDLDTLFKTNVAFGLVISAFAFLIGLIVVLLFSRQLFSGVSMQTLILILFFLPFLFLNQFMQPFFQGTQDFQAFNLTLLVGKITTTVLVAVLLLLFHGGVVEALMAYIAGQVLMLLVTFYLLKKRLSISYRAGNISWPYLKKSLLYGVKTHLSNILAFFNYRADMFVISFFLTPVAVGLYVVAVSIAEKLWIFSKGISSVLFPRIASSNDEADKNHITSVLSRNVFLLSIVAGLLLYFFAGSVIELLFGNAYHNSYTALKLMMPGIVFGGMARIISNDIAGRGKPEINLYTSIFTVVTNIVLNIIFVPIYGIDGAASVTSVTYLMNWVIKVVIFKKITDQPYSTFLLIHSADIKLYSRLLRKLKPGV